MVQRKFAEHGFVWKPYKGSTYRSFVLPSVHLFIRLFICFLFLFFLFWLLLSLVWWLFLSFVLFFDNSLHIFGFFYRSDSRNGWTLTQNWLQVKQWRHLKTTNQRWRTTFFFCLHWYYILKAPRLERWKSRLARGFEYCNCKCLIFS